MEQTKTWIEVNSKICNGQARVRDTDILVWSLVEIHNQGLSDQEVLSRYPELNYADLDEVWNYYRNHIDEIDQAILDYRSEEERRELVENLEPVFLAWQAELTNRGIQQGKQEVIQHLAKKLLQASMDPAQVASVTELPIEQIREILAEL